MHLRVSKKYLDRLYEPLAQDDAIQRKLAGQSTEKLNYIALDITSVSITCMRSFSHNSWQMEYPDLHRTIAYAVHDHLENLPSHIGRDDDIRFYLWQFFRFSLNLSLLLDEEGLSKEAGVKDLFPILAFGREWLSIT